MVGYFISGFNWFYRKKQLLTILCFVLSTAVQNIASAQIITTFAGTGVVGYSGDNGPASAALFNIPTGIAVDPLGNVFIVDQGNSVVRKVNTSGIITTFAGTGTAGYSGDGTQATTAKLNQPSSVAVDQFENVYITDDGNNVIRKVNNLGVISTFAGNGAAGYYGDLGPASAAALNSPTGVAVDRSGNVYIADNNNNVIRKVFANDTIITIAGPGFYTTYGDGGNAIVAYLNSPKSVFVDTIGNLYVADAGNFTVRKINTANIISTVAGMEGSFGYSGDGGYSTSAKLSVPTGMIVDAGGNLFIADFTNDRIRKVTHVGYISTYAGIGSAGYTGDGGAAAAAKLSSPYDVAEGPDGSLYITDRGNNVVRVVQTTTGITNVSTNSYTLDVYPNPSTGSFKFNLPETNETITITVTDMLGRIMETKSITGSHPDMYTMNPGNLAAGAYLLTVSANGISSREQIEILK